VQVLVLVLEQVLPQLRVQQQVQAVQSTWHEVRPV
jgi:hypothetical protein